MSIVSPFIIITLPAAVGIVWSFNRIRDAQRDYKAVRIGKDELERKLLRHGAIAGVCWAAITSGTLAGVVWNNPPKPPVAVEAAPQPR